MNNNLLVILAVVLLVFVSFKKDENYSINSSEIAKLKNELKTLNQEVDSLSHINSEPSKDVEKKEETPVAVEHVMPEKNNETLEKLDKISKSIDSLIECNCPKKEEVQQIAVVKPVIQKKKVQKALIKEKKEIKTNDKIIIINKIINNIPDSQRKQDKDKIIIEDISIKKPIDLLK